MIYDVMVNLLLTKREDMIHYPQAGREPLKLSRKPLTLAANNLSNVTLASGPLEKT